MELKVTTQFKKDLKRYKHHVNLMNSLEIVLCRLQEEGEVAPEYLPHPLRGDYKDCMECHVMDDFLLIWFDKSEPVIKLLRLGSHAELFGKGKKK
ncbi:MAG: type II toxin-antitoxin system YafQ family toxin [Prevotella sp.]|uniref:type II toxin-antitoxin system YafQ family toxin n=1 Tax=Prevotella sp. AGR2160 TaxID=1280674 RepID=UPI00040E117E|nr:type II toxin-antitoxin system YafQ family toxin [Prevotella sp. AGR2160]MDD5861961.1 type II toxin-antitoxin system YafQ family toxin [Prevotella sp.]